jgi:hypothetical protein
MTSQAANTSATRYLLLLLAVGLAAVLAVGVFVREKPMGFMESGYASRVAQRDMIAACDFGELAFFGDSMVEAAVMPRKLSMKSVNLAFGAASPIELYYWVESALQCAQPPRQVVLSVASHQFESISPYLWENNARPGFLSFHQLQEISRAADALNDPSFHDFRSPDGLRGFPRNLLYGHQFPTLFFNSLVAARGNGRLKSNAAKYAATLDSRGHSGYAVVDAAAGVLRAPQVRKPATARASADGAQPDAFHPLPIQDHYFRKLIELLASRGMRVAFIPMPASVNDHAQPSGAQQQAFKAYLQAHAARQPALALVAAPGPWPASSFADGIHMAVPAAEVFSGLLDACVQRAFEPGAAVGAAVPCDLEPRAR